MPSFLLNGAGGYVVTENGDRIIVAPDDLFDEIEVFAAGAVGWQVRPGMHRWEVKDAPAPWRAAPAHSRWEVF